MKPCEQRREEEEEERRKQAVSANEADTCSRAARSTGGDEPL